MGLDSLIDAQLYMCSRQQCDDSLPEEKDGFLFQPTTHSRCGIEELKHLQA
jgi:hypothetical protein